MIEFTIPYKSKKEKSFINEVIASDHRKGDGPFNYKALDLLKMVTGSKDILLTPSCTAALELSAILIDIKPGDEVIMPSFTFVSTANAFLLRGAKIIFVDIERETMNINPEEVERAITSKTRAIVVVHYAGNACNLKRFLEIKRKYNLFLIEDAAQAIGSYYERKHLGTIGDIGCFSFHDTKNINCGEGGAILVNNSDLIDRAEIIREKGTNRKKFIDGVVDKYTWKDIGSSFLPSEMQAAILYAQLLDIETITTKRKKIWDFYYQELYSLIPKLQLPCITQDCDHNAHIFHVKTRSNAERAGLIRYLKGKNINTSFHYIPLHSTEFGLSNGKFHGEDRFTSEESEKLVRLPLHNYLSQEDVIKVTLSVKEFFHL